MLTTFCSFAQPCHLASCAKLQNKLCGEWLRWRENADTLVGVDAKVVTEEVGKVDEPVVQLHNHLLGMHVGALHDHLAALLALGELVLGDSGHLRTVALFNLALPSGRLQRHAVGITGGPMVANCSV